MNIVLGATVLGLLLAPFYTVPFFWGSAFVGVALLLLVVTRKRPVCFSILFFLVFLLFANLRYPFLFQQHPDIDRLDALTKKVSWTGKIRSVDYLAGGRTSLDVQLMDIKGETIALAKGVDIGVRVYIGNGSDKDFFRGDLIHMHSRLRKPRRFGVPGEFDWPRYLQSRGIVLTTWEKNSQAVKVVEPAADNPGFYLAYLRRLIARQVNVQLTAFQAPLVRALILGEGKVITPEVRRILARSGVSHLFAISGLHVGLVGLYMYVCLVQIWKLFPQLASWQPPQRVVPVLIAPCLLAFLVFTGGSLATQRACFLAIVAAIMLLYHYHVGALQMLASAATIFLLVTPFVLWNAGWQLSFIGAAAILYAGPLLQNLPVRGILGYVVKLFLVSFVATLATFPFVLANFHMFAPFGVLANMVAVPLVTLLALPVGLAGVVSFPLWPPLASWCLWFSGHILGITVNFCQWFSSFPFFSGHYFFLSRGQVLATFLGALSLLFLLKTRHRRQIYRPVAVFALAAFLWPLNDLNPAQPSVTMVSVGQGEAILLQDGDGRAVLIDGGGLYSDTFDVGERLVAPALGMFGVRSLSAVVLTHDHPDHSKGLPFIIGNFEVGAFYAGQALGQLHPALVSRLKERGVPLIVPPPGWSDIPFGNMSLHLFSPGVADRSENDSSLVVRWLLGRGQGVLLTGDLEYAGVRTLIAEHPGAVDILKLPHHGSRFSGTPGLIQEVQPKICLVSSGFRNRYRLPARSLVEYIEKRAIPLLRTDLQGTVRLRFEKGGWVSESWINGLFR